MQRELAKPFAIETAADLKAAFSINDAGMLGARDRFDLNNRIFVFLIAFGAPLLGSFASVGVWMTFVWAIISLTFNRYPRVWSRDELAMGICFAAFGAIHILTTFFNSGFSGYDEMVPALIFFAPLLLVPRFALSDNSRIFDLFVLGAAIGTVLGALVGAFEGIILGDRAEGLLGNPGILAIIGCSTAGIGGLNLRSSSRRRQILGILSLLAILPIVISTQMRALWPSAILILLFFVITAWPSAVSKQRSLRLFGALAASVAIILVASWPLVEKRIEQTKLNIDEVITAGNFDNSIGQRLLMWDAAVEAISERPLIGYGMSERMDVVRDVSSRYNPDVPLNYSHAHNAALTALLDAGIFGLLALIVICVAPLALALKKRDGLVASYFAVIAIAYGGSGLTGIMFHHDLTDAFYVFAVIVGMAKLVGSGRIQAG